MMATCLSIWFLSITEYVTERERERERERVYVVEKTLE
jgi:hypothetical protein